MSRRTRKCKKLGLGPPKRSSTPKHRGVEQNKNDHFFVIFIGILSTKTHPF